MCHYESVMNRCAKRRLQPARAASASLLSLTFPHCSTHYPRTAADEHEQRRTVAPIRNRHKYARVTFFGRMSGLMRQMDRTTIWKPRAHFTYDLRAPKRVCIVNALQSKTSFGHEIMQKLSNNNRERFPVFFSGVIRRKT